MLVLPEEIATALGLRRAGTKTVVYADERRERRPVAGPVRIGIADLTTELQCIVGRRGTEVLVGQMVLEALDLVADCTNRTVAPRHPEGPVLAVR